MSLTLSIDEVTFSELEVPQTLSGPGGTQSLAVKEFPGGTKTLQTMGAFPHDLKWDGILFGSNAFDRDFVLDRKRVVGLEVTVQFGRYKYLGIIKSYTSIIISQWHLTYSIEIEVRKDESGQAQVPAGTVTPEAQLGQAMSGLQAYTAAPADGFALPTSVSSPIQSLQSTISSALFQAGGVIAQVSQANVMTITAGIATAQQAVQPLVASIDAITCSAGADLTSYLGVIQGLFSAPSVVLTGGIMINPNLFALASQYYGDATQWVLIAVASGLLDPQPIGQFTITVPQLIATAPG